MIFSKGQFSLVMLMCLIVAQVSLQSVLAMNDNQIVQEPFDRIMTPFVFFQNGVSENFLYISVDDALNKKYQVHQLLYNEQYNNSNQGVSNELAYDQDPSLYGALQVFVADPLVDLFDENRNVIAQIPMGSSFYAKKYDNDFLEFFDHNGKQRLISTKSVHLINDLALLNDDQFRELVCRQALKLQGLPFQWGGRCACKDSGFDASGFVNIIYLSSGVKMNRSMTTLLQKNKLINPKNIKKGDLIFMCNTHGFPQTVLVYLGDDEIIEAYPFNGSGKITKAHFSELFGKPVFYFQDGEFVKKIAGDDYFIRCREVLRSSQPLSFV